MFQVSLPALCRSNTWDSNRLILIMMELLWAKDAVLHSRGGKARHCSWTDKSWCECGCSLLRQLTSSAAPYCQGQPAPPPPQPQVWGLLRPQVHHPLHRLPGQCRVPVLLGMDGLGQPLLRASKHQACCDTAGREHSGAYDPQVSTEERRRF